MVFNKFSFKQIFKFKSIFEIQKDLEEKRKEIINDIFYIDNIIKYACYCLCDFIHNFKSKKMKDYKLAIGYCSYSHKKNFFIVINYIN